MQKLWGDTLVNVKPSAYCLPDFTGQGMPQMLRISVAPAMYALPESPLFPQEEPNLHTISTGYPKQVVAVGIVGAFSTTPAGNKYILVAMDYFTRWAEVYVIPSQEAITVANKLVDEMFLRFSPPDQLHSDQGHQFESKIIVETCKILGVKKIRTTVYHPQY